MSYTIRFSLSDDSIVELTLLSEERARELHRILAMGGASNLVVTRSELLPVEWG